MFDLTSCSSRSLVTEIEWMRAAVCHKYGPPEVVAFEEVPKPTPRENEVLLKIHATSLNLSDWEMLTGTPFYTRTTWGLFKSRFKILGSDVAGRVEAVGDEVTRFKPGDEVFGDIMGSFGGFAEYACAREQVLTLKPARMTFEDAAVLPQAGVIALRGIRDKGRLQAGQKVLINGAGGGSGTFAVQLAKSLGAEVTGVDNTGKQDFMRSNGADHVVDYTKEDFTKNGQRYDLILDLVAQRSLFAHKRVLAPGGTYLLVGGSAKRLYQALVLGPIISMFGSSKMGLLIVGPKQKDNVRLLELVESGTMKPIIDRRFPLTGVPDALRLVGEGHALGKVVVTM